MAIKNLTFNVEAEKQTLENLIIDGLKETITTSRRNRLHARDSYCGRRNAILAVQNGTSETDMIFELYTEIGKTIEDIIIRGLKNSKALLYRDYVLPSFGAALGGRIDAIALIDGKIRILEIKSIGEIPAKPKGSHLAQAKTYAAVCGLPYSILYISRKIQRFDGYKFLPDLMTFNYSFDIPDLKAHMFDILRSNECINRGLLPPKLHKFKTQCEHCDFTNYCFNDVADSRITLVPPTPTQELEIIDIATKQCDELMTEDRIKDRRNGILTHIQNTNSVSKKLLGKLNWDEASK